MGSLRLSGPACLCAVLLFSACTAPQSDSGPGLTPAQLPSIAWDDLVRQARGSAVNFGMHTGDEERNRYFRETVTANVQRKYGMTLRIVGNSDTGEVVSKLLNEKAAGKLRGGSIDVVWINGENFRTAKQGGLLWGPFADHLPNVERYDAEIRRRDFGTAIEGYEAPWQRAHFVLTYDSARVSKPPKSMEALRDWIESHPGRFTYVAPPDYTGSVFIRHILLHFGGGARPFQSGFDEALYARASHAAIAYLNEIKPYLWRRGETYPATVREADRLFANQEIDFAMHYSPSYASQRIERGDFPPTTRTFVFDSGTIGNYNFLAIPFNASNPAGALVLINHLMSFEQVFDLSRALRSPFPQRMEGLSPQQRKAVEALPRGPATLPEETLARHFLPEPDAVYLERFEKDWLEHVLRQ